MGPGTPEKWSVDRHHPRRLPSHWGEKKGREKLLREVLVQVLQVSLAEGPIYRLIGAAAATKIQPVQRLALPAKPVNVKTPGDSAHIACAGASLKTAARSCHRL